MVDVAAGKQGPVVVEQQGKAALQGTGRGFGVGDEKYLRAGHPGQQMLDSVQGDTVLLVPSSPVTWAGPTYLGR
ncbi:hypothetical protein R6V09_02650 [Streptomyces sp. W16]|uniref:hypothetical protein n=1 Tax=Streptomyces sp. W16 TaxID=3076631 RepID=UPI00295BCDBB|nr:hypothetical protein [Streptomyces sp. W16]MDV9169040.1 hypothetical protein [Streptomyces sp. W16]